MGKKSKGGRSKPVVRIMPTPMVNTQAKKAADAMQVDAAASAAAVAATQQAAAAQVATTTKAPDDGGALTRKEEVATLPRMGGVTKLKPVANCISMLMVPLRSAAAAAAYFDEGATAGAIAEKTRGLAKIIDELLTSDLMCTTPLAAMSEGRRVDLQAQRDSAQRNNCRGIYKLRIEAAYEAVVRSVLSKILIVLPADVADATHEVVADTKLYPGAMVEQIYLQNGITATPMWNAAEQAVSYVYKYGSKGQEALVEKKEYLVKLGKNGIHGTFVPRVLKKKIQWETIFAYGITGLGSGRDFLLPEVAGSLGLSTDLVQMRGAEGVRQGVGTVVAIKFPYDKTRYAKVMELLDVCHFRLPIGSSHLAITLAASPVELAQILALNLVQAEEEDAADDETPPTLELRFEEVGGSAP